MQTYKSGGMKTMAFDTPNDVENTSGFNSGDYWQERYESGRTSGAGSYNRLADFKAEIINSFVESNGVHSVIEWGCGDGNQLQYMNFDEYLGLDVSSSAIGLCKTKFCEDPTKEFKVINDEITINKEYELALSLDVIFHLVEDSVFEKYMVSLFSSSSKYVCIYSSNTDDQKKYMNLVKHVRHREFTGFVADRMKGFELISHIKNKYPYNLLNPKNTSFADFYFYELKS